MAKMVMTKATGTFSDIVFSVTKTVNEVMKQVHATFTFTSVFCTS